MQSAIGLAELDRIDTWNMPARRRNAEILISRLRESPLIKFFPVDTPERRNGWYVMAFSLDVENMSCDIQEFAKAAAAEGAPVWKVFWPQCHTEKAFQEHRAFGDSGFPFESKEYADPEERGLQQRGSAERASGTKSTRSRASGIRRSRRTTCTRSRMRC